MYYFEDGNNNDICYLINRKKSIIFVAKRIIKQEKILDSIILTKDDRNINALLSFAKKINKDYDIKITDAVEKAGGLALEVYNVTRLEKNYLKEKFIKYLREDKRES